MRLKRDHTTHHEKRNTMQNGLDAAGEPRRVVVAQRQTLLRQVLVRLLSGVADIEIAGEAATGAEALERIAASTPAIALLDEDLAGDETSEIVAAVTAAGRTRVVVLAYDITGETVEALLAAGADAVVSKALSLSGLADTVRRIAQRGPR
jgi:DNA-binding NarL/FixJ family response regulator